MYDKLYLATKLHDSIANNIFISAATRQEVELQTQILGAKYGIHDGVSVALCVSDDDIITQKIEDAATRDMP